MFCSRPLVCVLSFVGGVVVGCLCPCWVCCVRLVGCFVIFCVVARQLRVGVVCSRLLLPRVFLFVCGLLVFVGVVGVGLCAFASGWCWFVSVVLFGVCLCGFSLLFCRVVGFRGCGFFVGVVRFSCLSPVFVCRALGFRFSLFRPFVLSKFLLSLLGFGVLGVFSPCHY